MDTGRHAVVERFADQSHVASVVLREQDLERSADTGPVGAGQCEAERGSVHLVGLDPQPATVALDDPLADGQAHPAAGVRR